jgi:hypothetical protein
VVVGETLDVVLGRVEAGGSGDPRLAHRPAHALRRLRLRIGAKVDHVTGI